MRLPVAREGVRYIIYCAALAAATLYLRPVYAVIPALLTLYLVYFFRDPRRDPGLIEGAVIAPAEGKIVRIDQTAENGYLDRRVRRVSIFLSIFDVHINYAPVSGTIDYMHYRKGSFRNAMRDISSVLNENNTIGIKSERTVLAIRQIAGMIARRIVCRCSVGDRVQAGDRIGMIKFGSRVDIFLPLSAELLVERGQKVKGGETIIARLA